MTPGQPQSQRGVDPLPALSPPAAPECPAGWVIGPPDFVGVGAQRSGTTWWHRLITAHPGVCFERGRHAKEVHYFDTLGDRAGLTAEEVHGYHRYFPRPAGLLVGEWTPRYMVDPWVPQQLAQAAPDARVLIMLRDPVDRFASGYARGRRLAAERGAGGIDAELRARHIELGMYHDQLRRVLDAFERDRVLVLQYEGCRLRTRDELRRTCEFLRLDPDRSQAHVPPREPRERALSQAERAVLAELFAPDVRRLAGLLPQLDVSLWGSVAGLV